ncbi:hypothetical protein HKX48_009174 [Thoreauomyces humboldtii]|nr:hypothetical protein HKX48_009174 [Thoreauomyces humboldtii]
MTVHHGFLAILLATATAVVNAYDPTPAATPLASNLTLTLPALACTTLTYTLPANHTLSMSLSVSPPLLALGLTDQQNIACTAPETAVSGSDYQLLLDTTRQATPPVVYTLTNVTSVCWDKDVALTFFAATAFANAYGKTGSDAVKAVTFGSLVVLPTGNRTCVHVADASKGPTATQVAAPPAQATLVNGQTAPAATSTAVWGLLPPPPGSSVRTASGSGDERLGALAVWGTAAVTVAVATFALCL